MSPERKAAIDYLRAPANAPWRWAENGSVLVWKDGLTVAFREEITEILEWLAPNGLPPFGAIVFLLAACKGKTVSMPDLLGEPSVPHIPGEAKMLVVTTLRRQLLAQVEEALDELKRLSSYPQELISGLKSKCVLAEAIFETAKVERYVQPREVLQGMLENLTDSDLLDPERTGAAGSMVRQLHLVSEGLKLHTTDALQLRLRTGLDSLPKEADLDLPAAERARRLIDELSRDRDYGIVARAARELMAAVRLPRRLAEREELAVGGVADISNRGPLDRLLLSELAHDDLTLSVRVALNEALYLRREPPQREPPGTMALLLDSGIRLWGVPRVLVTAVALALIACEKHHSKIIVYRAQGKRLIPVDLLSRKGLVEHLSSLEVEVHPGEAISTFVAELPAGEEVQSVLITHPDVLDDAEFRHLLKQLPKQPGFVASVERSGRFELHPLPLAGRRPICEADLDLASVVGQEQSSTPLIDPELSLDLPAIFGVSPFPFLLPIHGRVDHWISHADGFTYAALNDRRLIQFRDYRSGGRALASEIPGGAVLWMDCVDGVLHAVKAGSGQRPPRLLSQSLQGGPLRTTELAASGPELQAIHRYGDVIVAIRSHDIRAYSLMGGHSVGQALNPYRWVHGRYLLGKNNYYFVIWDGERVKLEPVALPASMSRSDMALIFDCDGMDGPWLVLNTGTVICSATGEVIALGRSHNLGMNFRQVRVSRDGHRLFIPASHTNSGYLYNLKEKKFFDLSEIPRPELDASPRLPNWNLYRVFQSIAVSEEGIALCGRKGQWRKFVFFANKGIRISSAQTHNESVPFKEPVKTKYGCLLQTAMWPNGSMAFLDSRGLLHLKSHNRAVPEISLVLADVEVAGWTSDGHVCGPPFFFDSHHAAEPDKVFLRIKQFVDNL